MAGQIISLYDIVSPGGSCGLSCKTWSTLPYNGNDGSGSEKFDFLLPDVFEWQERRFGTFIVHRETGKICPISVAFDGRPLVSAPDGGLFKLEYA